MSLHYDGSDVEPDGDYIIRGSTIRGILKIAAEMSSGVKMDADRRRDAAQWLQEQITLAIELK